MKKILFTLLCTLLPLIGWAQENEAYAVLSNDNTVLTFYYDGQKATRNGLSVAFTDDAQSWIAGREYITTVVFDTSFAGCTTLTSTAYWFYRCWKLAVISGIENLKTDNVTDMRSMFVNCWNLTSLDVSGFKTDNVTNMGSMFSGCSGLTSLDVSGFKTDNVTNMGYMFSGCSGLTSFDVSGFKTDNVTNMGSMFSGCSGLTSFDVSGFKTDNVTNMGSMFSGCSGLTSLDLGNFDTSNVVDMGYMFIDCSGLTSLDVSGFKTDNVADMSYMFTGCSGLTSLDVSGFKTDNVAYMEGMFCDCSGLTSLDVSGFKTDNVTDIGGMFDGCSGLTSLDVSGFKTDNVADIGDMFSGCSGLTSLDVSGFKTDNVAYMSYMFSGCSGLTSLDVSGFKTDNVERMSYMFDGCSGLTSLDVSGFKTDNVRYMSGMFSGCSGLTSLDVSGFKTDNVTYMSGMFYGCSGLTTIYVGEGWNTATVTDGSSVFFGCSSLVGGKGTKYDAGHTDHTYARIDQGPDSDAPGYFTRSEKSTFDGRVLTVRGSGSIDQALAQVGGFEQVDKTITAIVWEADVPYTGEAAFSNPNLLFYGNDATKGQAISNLVYNGVAESITLTDEGEGNIDFYCPQSFTAQSITYRRNFRQQTEIGVSRGWETIALPFTVQTIGRVRSDEGLDRITPFGSSEGERHFWLRRLTTNGLQSVQTIEANTPYIIAMPNSEEYAAGYNLAGDIVFTAENATVAVTEPVSDRSADYELTACFERMAAQDSIYVLNVGDARQGYPEGSIFEAGYRALQPFRAYTRHVNNGRPAPRYFALGSLGGDGTTGISTVGHDDDAPDAWYDMQGRKLQGKPTRKGVYIQNGRKVIVR